MFTWFKRKLDEIGSPFLDWVQVEVTTYCNSACIYCPRTARRSNWLDRHMSLELFQELSPFLINTTLVYLQGWGEPLLNKDLFQMIRICKDQGNRVGFTTNGMLLTDATVRKLVDAEVDILGVSLAGTTAKTHNKFRSGCDFDVVISHLEHLREVKREKESQLPAVHLAYLMLKSNFNELKEIVPLAERLGVQQIVASNLSLVVEPSLSAETIFHDTEDIDYYRAFLKSIEEKASQENITFAYNGPGLDAESLRCGENVSHACVINVEGEVVPCVFTNPVLSKEHEVTNGACPTYVFRNQSLPLKDMSFGNVGSESLTRIWNKKEYSRLRGLLDQEIPRDPDQILSKMPGCCLRCYKRLLT